MKNIAFIISVIVATTAESFLFWSMGECFVWTQGN